MSTAFAFSPARRWAFLAPLTAAYRRWQFRKLRTCVCSGLQAEPDVDPAVFIARGQYRGAVLMARLQLENAIGELFIKSRSVRGDRIHVKSTRAPMRVGYMVRHGSFDKTFQAHFEGAYGRASRVVHGQHCPKKRAISIVNQVREVIAELETYERPFVKAATPTAPTPRKVISGFAAGVVGPVGVASFVTRTRPFDDRWVERTSDDQLAIDDARAERVLEGGAV